MSGNHTLAAWLRRLGFGLSNDRARIDDPSGMGTAFGLDASFLPSDAAEVPSSGGWSDDPPSAIYEPR
jgi:hypothetical protein